MEITETSYKQLRGQKGEIESQVETKLEQTRSSMEHLNAENRRLEGQN